MGAMKAGCCKHWRETRFFFKTVHRFTQNKLFMRIGNVEYLVVFDELAGTGWKLVGVVPSRELWAAHLGTIGKVTLYTWLFSLFIAFLFSAYLSWRILRPLYSLAQVMKTFHHNLALRMEVDSGDAIGILHQSFDKLMEKIAKLIAENNEISRREKEAELKALQAQINPHFLYNTLESINWLALKYNAREINAMVTALGNFLRHSLNKGKELISIANELEQVTSYLTIQKFRFQNKFNVAFAVPPELNSYTIIKLVLQPLVENAIHHGFKEMASGGEIMITGCFDGEYILIRIMDNGLGTDTELLNQILAETQPAPAIISESYGIHNVNERLKLYFGAECGLHFSGNDWGGVTATIRIRALPFGDGLPKP